jgi:hypothetical protein
VIAPLGVIGSRRRMGPAGVIGPAGVMASLGVIAPLGVIGSRWRDRRDRVAGLTVESMSETA